MLIWRIAWRSFLRHRRRSIITGAAIALGLAMMLVFLGLGQDAHDRMAELGIRLGSGNVLVQGNGFQDRQTLDEVVRDPARVMDIARRLPGVSRVASRVRGSGLLTTGASSAAVVVTGVDPATEPLVSTIAAPASRVAGDYLRSRAQQHFVRQPADIYVGAQLARTLDLQVGDRVVLTVSPRGGSRPTSVAFLVCGVFRTGLDDLDSFAVEIPIGEAQSLFGLGGMVSQVAVLTDHLDDTAPVAAALERALAGRTDLEVLPWQEAMRELYEAIVLDDLGFYLMMAIVFVIAGIGIFNTVLMSVVERTREFGVMMAIGTSKRRLFAMVMAEAVILALAAALVGLTIGLSLHAWLHHTGFDLTALYGEDVEFAGIALSGRVYSALGAADVVRWTLVVFGIVILSAAYPALRVTRLDPLEALRHA